MPVKTFAFLESPSAADFNRYFMQQIIVVKAADESVTSSTTIQADDHLFADVEASTNYFVTMFVIYDGDSAGDLRSQFTAPAGSTFNYVPDSVRAGWAGASLTVGEITRGLHTLATVPSSNCGGVGVDVGAPFKGILQVSTLAGVFRYNWAQNTSSVTATRVQAGSMMMLRRLTN